MTNTNRNTNKKYRVKSKFRFITSLVIMLGLTIGAFGIITNLSVSTALTEPQYTEVEIASGDTLWDIANTYKSDKTDPRKAVYTICQANNIEASDLQPGMIISVPKEL